MTTLPTPPTLFGFTLAEEALLDLPIMRENLREAFADFLKEADLTPDCDVLTCLQVLANSLVPLSREDARNGWSFVRVLQRAYHHAAHIAANHLLFSGDQFRPGDLDLSDEGVPTITQSGEYSDDAPLLHVIAAVLSPALIEPPFVYETQDEPAREDGGLDNDDLELYAELCAEVERRGLTPGVTEQQAYDLLLSNHDLLQLASLQIVGVIADAIIKTPVPAPTSEEMSALMTLFCPRGLLASV